MEPLRQADGLVWSKLYQIPDAAQWSPPFEGSTYVPADYSVHDRGRAEGWTAHDYIAARAHGLHGSSAHGFKTAADARAWCEARHALRVQAAATVTVETVAGDTETVPAADAPAF